MSEDKPWLRSVGGPTDEVTIAVWVSGLRADLYDELAEKRGLSAPGRQFR